MLGFKESYCIRSCEKGNIAYNGGCYNYSVMYSGWIMFEHSAIHHEQIKLNLVIQKACQTLDNTIGNKVHNDGRSNLSLTLFVHDLFVTIANVLFTGITKQL